MSKTPEELHAEWKAAWDAEGAAPWNLTRIIEMEALVAAELLAWRAYNDALKTAVSKTPEELHAEWKAAGEAVLDALTPALRGKP